MKKVSVSVLLIAVFLSLTTGGVVGFFLGIASTEAGAKFLKDLAEQEQFAETGTPKRLDRERFKLVYPGNWKIDAEDEDYDPDQRFSIQSPGGTYVVFVMGNLKTVPEENVQSQIKAFTKLMGSPGIERFESYGHHEGKGAAISGKILGTRVTVKAFSCFLEDMTAIIVQQYPDADLKLVEGGLSLIEKSFFLKPGKEQVGTDRPDAGNGEPL
jgi:hypothetical protein